MISLASGWHKAFRLQMRSIPCNLRFGARAIINDSGLRSRIQVPLFSYSRARLHLAFVEHFHLSNPVFRWCPARALRYSVTMAPMEIYSDQSTGRTRKSHIRPSEASVSDSPYTANNVQGISRLILDIFLAHALNKFEYTEDHLEGSKNGFLSVIARYVAKGERIQACLPAFPFKSSNKVYKVLGSLPDKAEELALERLNTLCMRVQGIYAPGAEIVIVSDGITYNGMRTDFPMQTGLTCH